jgi:egghead protein (zeste-white 4 protein)
MNTLSDSIRSSHDLGPLRFSLKYLNKPTMDFKGSFFVCQHGVEKSITFDHGLEGSITEDTYFVIKAVNNGFSCDWIEGEMLEQSPFTFMDFLRQRRRWHQGAYYVAYSKNLKRDFSGTAYKLLFINSILAMLGTVKYFLSFFYSVSFHPSDVCLEYITDACQWYFYCLGITLNFNFNRFNIFSKLLLFLTAPIIYRYLDVCHMISLIWALSTSKSDFQIVKKSHESNANKDIRIKS